MSESIVLLSSFVRAPEGSVWGETEFVCDSCGCPPVVQETTARSTDDNDMEYLIGRYQFDLRECPDIVDITFTFTANGQQLEKTVTVSVDPDRKLQNCASKV